jgi:hypothetical protein
MATWSVKYEVVEYDVSINGDRECMGTYFYDIEVISRIVRKGGAVKYEGRWIDTETKVNKMIPE